MADLSPDFHRRDCSLPMDCKDLLDVLNLMEKVSPEERVSTKRLVQEKSLSSAQGKPTKCVEIGEFIQVKTLANLLSCRPFQVVGQLIKFHVFKPNGDAWLTFEEAEEVALQMGFEVRRLN
jgi:hypothetical protein